MRYRTFGKTGLQISSLGFGCMRLPVIGNDRTMIDDVKAMEMIHHAIDHGVNYIDTAYPYHAENFSTAGSSEPFLARALKNGYREKVYLATKLPSWLVESREDMDKYLEEQLIRLNTETIDLYLLHSLNRSSWDKLVRLGVFDFMNKALKDGKIHYAGFSFHDDVALFKEIVDSYDWSFCQIMYNYFDENFQAGKEGLEYAVQKGLAVIVMEPLRGGALVKGLPQEARKILKEAAPHRTEVGWALQWLWNQPEVSIVLSGMSHLDHVLDNIELADNFFNETWTKKDRETIILATRVIRNLQRVDCTSCGYCLPCPQGVDIPRNFSLCNDHYTLHDPSAKSRYHSFLSDSQKASNCTQCGECVEKCPQQIPIPEELEHISELFGSYAK